MDKPLSQPILPPDFIQQTRALMGSRLFDILHKGLTEAEPSVSIRLNPWKAQGMSICNELSAQPVPWCDSAFYLNSRPNFTFDPLLHAGTYYVQDASSMFIAHVLKQVLNPNDPIHALDLCAAPGGKSTLTRSTLPQGSLLVSNEPVRNRAHILQENMVKWGHPDTMVTNNYAADFRKARAQFDLILTDVPCSGEGMFRKDPGAIEDWSLRKVEECQQLQRKIISDIWPCLRPGGVLIYSTCTFNAQENEDNIAWILSEFDASPIDIPVKPEWHITPALRGTAPAYRFLPGLTRGEGLFVCALRKQGEKLRAKKDNLKKQLCKNLRILQDGITPPEQKGKTFIPNHSAVMSTVPQACTATLHRAELTYQQAIQYLRHEAIVLGPDIPTGLIIVTYQGRSLGLVKNLGSRSNNLYPDAWRIKSTYIPEQPQILMP